MKTSNNIYWKVPRIWPGSTVFIIGGGPSLLKQDLTLIQGYRVIGVNHAFELGSWVDICWYGDRGFYEDNERLFADYNGIIATCSDCRPAEQLPRVRYMGRSKIFGIETRRVTHVAWNHNSGASAINLAYHLGAKRAVLLGFDFKNPDDPNDKQTHWHNRYRPVYDSPGKLRDPYVKRFLKGFQIMSEEIKELDFEIINATEGSALEVFPRIPLEQICEELEK